MSGRREGSMHILLVNDDGFDCSYLHILCAAAANRGHEVTVCAPDTQQSAKSHAFTIGAPLIMKKDSMPGASRAYRIQGTPVDACRLGFMMLAEHPVDLVISGINEGYNVGFATFVSGTVGAAREAAFQGIPAMAVSQEVATPDETTRFFADYCIRLGEKLVHAEVPEFSVCNVNCPTVEREELRGAVVCGLNRNVYKDGYERRVSPRGTDYFWLKYEEQDTAPTPGSDLELLQKGYITVSFLAPEGCRQEDYADFPLPL